MAPRAPTRTLVITSGWLAVRDSIGPRDAGTAAVTLAREDVVLYCSVGAGETRNNSAAAHVPGEGEGKLGVLAHYCIRIQSLCNLRLPTRSGEHAKAPPPSGRDRGGRVGPGGGDGHQSRFSPSPPNPATPPKYVVCAIPPTASKLPTADTQRHPNPHSVERHRCRPTPRSAANNGQPLACANRVAPVRCAPRPSPSPCVLWCIAPTSQAPRCRPSRLLVPPPPLPRCRSPAVRRPAHPQSPAGHCPAP